MSLKENEEPSLSELIEPQGSPPPARSRENGGDMSLLTDTDFAEFPIGFEQVAKEIATVVNVTNL